MAPLTPLFQGIQAGLFAASTILLGGALYGLVERAGDMAPDMAPQGNKTLENTRTSGRAGSNKRYTNRMPCNLFLELLQGEKVSGTGRLVNLSPSGACFTSNAVFRSGDYVIARLPGLRKGVNKISGQVIWHRTTPSKTVYGIRLNRATPA